MNITLEQIIENANIVDSMSLQDTSTFLTKYKGKGQMSDVRKLVSTRKKLHEKIEVFEKTHNLKFDAIYHRVKDIYLQDNYEDCIEFHGRSIGNDIHDLPKIWSGYKSKSLIADPNEKIVYEHYWPRKWAGIQIVKSVIQFKERFTKAILVEMLHEFCHVHHVTKSENINLEPFQQHTKFNGWEDAYQKAGVKLVQIEPYKENPGFQHLLNFLKFNS